MIFKVNIGTCDYRIELVFVFQTLLCSLQGLRAYTYIGRNLLFNEFEVSRKRSNYSTESIREEILLILTLENKRTLRCFQHNWFSLDYFYKRYGHSNSNKIFRKNHFALMFFRKLDVLSHLLWLY